MTRDKNTLPMPVMIRWVDSTSRFGWFSRDTIKADCDLLVETLGYLIDETDDSYLVTMSFSADQVDSPMQIPKGAVTGFWELTIT